MAHILPQAHPSTPASQGRGTRPVRSMAAEVRHFVKRLFDVSTGLLTAQMIELN